jgi:hypothetical protein
MIKPNEQSAGPPALVEVAPLRNYFRTLLSLSQWQKAHRAEDLGHPIVNREPLSLAVDSAATEEDVLHVQVAVARL